LRIYYDYILLILSPTSIQSQITNQHKHPRFLSSTLRGRVAGRTTVVVNTSLGGVVGVAVVVEVNLVDTRLEGLNHGWERAKTVCVNGAAGVGIRDRDNGVVDDEADLLGDVAGRAVQDLGGEVRGERNLLGGDEGIGVLVLVQVERGTVEEGGQVERGEGVEDDDLVGGVGVDGLVEREVGGGVVEGLVESRHGGGEGVGETGNPLLEETLSLSGSDWGARTLVVVERL
jgi:hypothetical protein